MKIHSTAIIDKTAQIGKGVEIGAYVIVGKNVVIGDNVIIKAHTVIHCNTKIGEGTRVSTNASLGGDAQDISFKLTDETYLEIGKNCDIREFSTINRGTKKDACQTKIGDNCLIMSNAHIGHDCDIGNDVIVSTACGLAGHCKLGNNVILGGMVGLHHHLRIGQNTIIGGHIGLRKDVIPFSLVNESDSVRSANVIGLQRAGAEKSDITAISKVIKDIKNSNNILSELGLELCESDNKYIKEIGKFIVTDTKLGLSR